MEFAEAQKIMKDGGEVTDAVRAAISGYDSSLFIGIKDADARAAAARKEAEGKANDKIKEHESKLESLTNELKEAQLKAGSGDAGDDKRYEALTKQIESLTQNLESEKGSRIELSRKNAIAKINSGMGWKKDVVDSDYSNFMLDGAFKDLSHEDLGNPAITTPIIEGLKKDKPSLFAAADMSGSGNNPDTNTANSNSNTDVDASAILNAALTKPLADAEKTVNTAHAATVQ